jgi:hydrogenase expression/formation protein HypC
MCYAIPAKIIKIEGDSAEVDYGGVMKKINLSLIDNPRVGEFVLIHAGFAIEKLDRKSAEESLQIIRNQIRETEKNG